MACSVNQQSFLLCSSLLLIMAVSVSSFHPTFLPSNSLFIFHFTAFLYSIFSNFVINFEKVLIFISGFCSFLLQILFLMLKHLLVAIFFKLKKVLHFLSLFSSMLLDLPTFFFFFFSLKYII